MAISAKEVNELRKKTGAGMMDCKKALEEANGNFEEAIDILRKKGQKIAAKREDRSATEGAVLATVSADGKSGALIALNCETDFVAKNEDFVALANKVLSIALENKPATKEDLLALNFDGSMTVADKLTEQMGVIGEKIEVSSYETLTDEAVVAYIHPGNRLASIVAFNKNSDAVNEAGKQVAMQVAAMNPLAVNKDGISEDVIAKEIEIGKDLAIQEGKPAEMAEKIAQGRLGKFFKENTLLSQAFVRDNKLSVEQFLKTVDADLTATAFKRYSLI